MLPLLRGTAAEEENAAAANKQVMINLKTSIQSLANRSGKLDQELYKKLNE